MRAALLAASLAAGCGARPVEVDPQRGDDAVSASRQSGESFANAEARYRSQVADAHLGAYWNLHAAVTLAVPAAEVDVSAVPEWSGADQVAAAFAALRDQRLLTDSAHPGGPRRIPWLYPDDGCYARGDVAARIARSRGGAVAKVFAFGSLRLTTPYARKGSVDYWYHTAPVVRQDGEVVVLDPAVDAGAPLPLSDWLAQLNAGADARVAICAANAYGPYSACANDAGSDQDRGVTGATLLLGAEWERLVELGLDAAALLGDEPPWAAED